MTDTELKALAKELKDTNDWMRDSLFDLSDDNIEKSYKFILECAADKDFGDNYGLHTKIHLIDGSTIDVDNNIFDCVKHANNNYRNTMEVDEEKLTLTCFYYGNKYRVVKIPLSNIVYIETTTDDEICHQIAEWVRNNVEL